MIIPPVGPTFISTTAPITLPPATPALDTAQAAGATLSTIPLIASKPRLSISEYANSVADALLKQKIQLIIDALSDPTKRKELWLNAAKNAEILQGFLTEAYKYKNLQDDLKAINLEQQQQDLNDAIATHNNKVNGPNGDTAKTNALNSKITDYNTAQTNYQGALANYQGALSTYNNAESTYKSAQETWNAALATYQANPNAPNAYSTLQTARGVFDAAQTNFNNAKTTFNAAKGTLDTAKTNWQDAKTDLNTAITAYNTYAASRTAEILALNTQIAKWNTAVGKAAPIINEMNQIRTDSFLSETLISTPSTVGTVSNLPSYTLPTSGPNTQRNSVQAAIDQNNATIFLINTNSGTISGHVTTLNGSPYNYNPPLTSPPSVPTIQALPTANSDYNLSSLTSRSPLSNQTDPMPDIFDVDKTFIDPGKTLLTQLASFNKTIERTQINIDEDTTPLQPNKNTIRGGSGTSSSGISIEGTAVAKSPFLEEILSRQAYEAFFNEYGVPAGSGLTDKIGSLFLNYKAMLGLTSVAPAQDILGRSVPSGPAATGAINTSIALGLLKQAHNMSSEGELAESVGRLINGDPSLKGLSEEAKTKLIAGITGELGASLIKLGLNELAKAMNAPGLNPQLLAAYTGLDKNDALGSFQSQLFFQVLLKEEIAKALNLSSKEADALVQNALKGLTQFTKESIISAILNEMGKSSAPTPAQEQKIAVAESIARLGIQEEEIKSKTLQEKAFHDTLVTQLVLQGLDPKKATTLADAMRLDSASSLENTLVENGLSRDEAIQIRDTALLAASANNGAINPLGAFLLNQIGTPTEMAAYFKLGIINELSPVIGLKRATEVAEDYGSLMFSKPNSLMNLLSLNEKNILALKNFDYGHRLFEVYRQHAVDYLNPKNKQDDDLKLGKTLLLVGPMVGLSNQGITSMDNTLGPLSTHSKDNSIPV